MAGQKNFNIPECETCAVRDISFFGILEREELQDLSLNKGCSFYKKGQTIFQEGSRPIGAYCVFSGKVKIFKIGEEGREQIVRLAKRGDLLGYRSLITGESYSASATALEDCTICHVPKNIFNDLVEKTPNISMKLMQLLSHDLKESERRMTDLAQKPVRERLAQSLLTLSQIYGLEEDNKTMEVQLTREDLANIVGTATETVIRLLSELKKEKLIDLPGKKIILIDKNKLMKVANVFD